MLPALEKSLSLLVWVAGIERYLRATRTRDGYRCLPLHLHHAKVSSVRARRGVFRYSIASVANSWPGFWCVSELRLVKTSHRVSPNESPMPPLVSAAASLGSSTDALSSTAFVRSVRAHFFSASPV
ncbi:hypothetical protein ISCGN_005853 [Ixodes scapularis]